MKQIRLSGGYLALVDDEDYEALTAFKWSAHTRNGITYAGRMTSLSDGPRKRILMHRAILGLSQGVVDHADHNGLNNQKHNLRPCTIAQNGRNRRKTIIQTSKFKGVRKNRAKWEATIKFDGKQIFLGSFRDEVDAAQAYNFAAYELFGDYAKLNTPEGCI